jgi:CubicO group peptidase (beta-lactamase class C family)
MWKRLTIAIIFVAIVVALSKNLVLTGASFLSKRHCSARFVSKVVPAEEFAIPLLKLLPLNIRFEDAAVSADLFGFLPIATAYYHGPNLGCVLHRPEPFACDLGPPNEIVEEPLVIQPIAEIEAAIDDEFNSVLPNGEHRNVRAVVVIHKGKIIAERYRVPFNRATRQAGWSMTKSLLNTLVGRRQLNLDDYIWFPNGTRSTNIRIGHMLNMTSGLVWVEDYYPGGAPTTMLFLERNMPLFVADRGLKYQPGAYWLYSSGETNLLGYNLEKTFDSQCEYWRWVRDQFRALGLKSVVVEPDASGSLVYSSFGWATPRDWARWGHSQLNSDWTKKTSQLVDVSLTTGEKKPYAGHFWKKFDDPKSNRFYAEGFEFQYVAMNPDLDLVVVHMACARGDAYIDYKNYYQHKFLDIVETVIKAKSM